MKFHDPHAVQHISDINEVELRHMVGPDPHRPGTGNARLIAEQVPVWALVGYARAVSDKDELDETAMRRIACDYDVPVTAVAGALLYYAEHRAAIDARLEANPEALTEPMAAL